MADPDRRDRGTNIPGTNIPGTNSTGTNITGSDVARAAGVSQPTVSRALRGHPSVSESTRQRVQEVAEALGYVPHYAARSLVSRSAGQVAIVSTDWNSPFYPHLVAPMQKLLNGNGYRTVLMTEAAGEAELLSQLVDRSIDGVVLTTSVLDSTLPSELVRRGIPAVLVHRVIDGVNADSCTIDNYYGGRLAAEELLTWGHRRIATICGPPHTNTSRDRLAGFRAVLAEHGIDLPAELCRGGEYSYDTGYEFTHELLGDQRDITALFCANDLIALGAYSAAAARGVRVPQDLSIIGFDDVPLASWRSFGLTTVHCDVPRMAEVGISMLMDRIQQPDRSLQRVILQPTVVRRRTISAPGESLAGVGH